MLNEHNSWKTKQKAKPQKNKRSSLVVWLRFVWRVNNKTQHDCWMIPFLVNLEAIVHLMLLSSLKRAYIRKIVENCMKKEAHNIKPKFHISMVAMHCGCLCLFVDENVKITKIFSSSSNKQYKLQMLWSLAEGRKRGFNGNDWIMNSVKYCLLDIYKFCAVWVMGK